MAGSLQTETHRKDHFHAGSIREFKVKIRIEVWKRLSEEIARKQVNRVVTEHLVWPVLIKNLVWCENEKNLII